MKQHPDGHPRRAKPVKRSYNDNRAADQEFLCKEIQGGKS
jgi:hypothetical protein